MRARTFTLLVMLFCIGLGANAQVGKEFWFVAPEVTYQHGDNPIVFRITTFDKGANVTISSPGGGFSTVNTYVGPNTLYTVENYKPDDLENKPSFSRNKKGILITSDEDITVYYEVVHHNNPDKFTLKGSNALGKEFWVPSQNIYINNQYTTPATEKIDVVATEDATVIKVIPSIAVGAWQAGQEVEITLDKGESYCIENKDESNASSMAGTYLSSNKPIAVTISDDSVNPTRNNNGAWDLIGDQLIPTSVIGYEYVAMNAQPDASTLRKDKNGNVIYPINKVFVLATEDNTQININGSELQGTLNKGVQKCIDITKDNMFIQANKPVYVYQLSSLNFANGDELGSAILPHVECTGSTSVSFTRIFSYKLYMQVLIKGKDRNNFSVKGNTSNGSAVNNFLNGAAWVAVPGSGTGDDAWYTVNINLSQILGTGTPTTITNSTGLFHLSVLEQNNTSASYGYFSSYSNLKITGLTDVCFGDQLRLTTDVPMDTYKWYSLKTGDQVLSEDRDLYVTESGKYWVQAQMYLGECELQDSIDVIFQRPDIDLGPDQTVCPGTTLTFTGSADNNYTYAWSDGATGTQTTVDVGEGYSGSLSVTVTDSEGCSNNDEVAIDAFEVPELKLDRTSVCEGEVVSNTTSFEKYEWSYNGVVLNTDESQNFIVPKASGNYMVTAWTKDGCSVVTNFNITVNEAPIFSLSDASLCSGGQHTFSGPSGAGYSYQWNNGSTQKDLTTDKAGTYTLEVTDVKGCVASETADLVVNTAVPVDLGPDRKECIGIDLNLVAGNNHLNYIWSFNGTVISPSPGNTFTISNAQISNSGKYKVIATDANGCQVEDEVNLVFTSTNPPILYTSKNMCEGKAIEITASNNYDSYVWKKDGSILGGETGKAITSNGPGVYLVEATKGGCMAANQITVTEYTNPQVSLQSDFTVCDETETLITVDNARSDSGIDYLYWNGNNTQQIKDWRNAGLKVTQNGTYSVTVVDVHGCVASDDVQVSFSDSPDFTLSDISSCAAGNSLTLVGPANANYDYLWSDNSTSKDLVVSQTGNYSLQVTDRSSGCISSASASAVFYNSIPLDLGPDRAECVGIDVTLSVDNLHSVVAWYKDGSEILPNPGNDLLISGTSVVNSGNYRAVVMDANGCTTEDEVAVNFYAVDPPALTTSQNLCGDSRIVIEATSGYESYLWNNGATSSSITVDQEGLYKVTARTTEGCVAEKEITVHAYTNPTVLLSGDLNLCDISETAIKVEEMQEGSGGFEYLYWNGNNTQRFNDLSAELLVSQNGTYSVTVVDSYGCMASDDIKVSFNQSPKFVLNDATACAGGTHTFVGPTGTGYSYEWNEGSLSKDLTVSVSGDYILKVTAANGCASEESARMEVFNPIAIDLGYNNKAEECAGVDLVFSAGDAHSMFQWFKDNVMLGNTGSEYRISNAAVQDNGTYKVIALDPNGCQVEDQVDVLIQPTTATPELMTSHNLCGSSPIDISAAEGYTTYEWTDATSTVIGSSHMITVNQSGIYYVTATKGACEAKGEITVEQYSNPTVTLPLDASYCDNEATAINVQWTAGDGAFDYLYWNGNSNQRYDLSAAISVDRSGTYTVTAVDEYGCEASDVVDVIYNLAPVFTLNDARICDGESFTLVGPSGSYSYLWTGGSASKDLTVSQPGNYTLSLTDANGCTAEATAELIVVSPAPLSLSDSMDGCEGSELVIFAGNIHNNFEWFKDGNPLLSNSGREYIVNNPGITDSGNYRVVANDANGCQVEDNIDVTINPGPSFELQDITICPGNVYTVSGPAQSGYTYLWSNGSTNQNTELEKGKHTLKVTDANGCSSTETMVVDYYPAPVVDLGADEIICPVQDPVILDAGNFVSYKWHNGEITRTIKGEMTDTVNYVAVIDENGCRGFDTKMLSFEPTPELELLSDTFICFMDTLTLSVSENENIGWLEWSNGSNDFSINIADEGHYWVRATDGCHWFNDTMSLVLYPTPVVANLDTTIFAQVVLYAQGGTEPYQYALNDADFQESNVFKNLENGEYTFTVQDVNGCMAYDTVSIYSNLDIDIPPFFTPNGDGYNEEWVIGGLERFPDSEIRIYNRFGKLLVKYKASEQGWDGKYLGKPVRSDDYWYVIELNPTKKLIKGNVSVKR